MTDVLVVGGGPAGMAAAVAAAESGSRVVLADDNPGLGGQIWRGEGRAVPAGVEVLTGARIFSRPEPGLLLAEQGEEVVPLRYGTLVLAPGARERFLPFPGWTLPGVTGAGGLQALVKSGLPIRGKRVVVAGTGPLLLAVAAYLKGKGAEVAGIAEQAPASRLLRFGLGLSPGKLLQAARLRRSLGGIPLWTGGWVVEAGGEKSLDRVTLRRGGKTWSEPCDYLACGFHLVPNLELPALFGCRLAGGAVAVDDFQETSLPGTYCAGEATGIGGVELAEVEGRIAGSAAAGDRERAAAGFAERARRRRFARRLERAFALRPELRELPRPETLVCRCEDVSWERLRGCASWREAKLHTRCGMGPCQGRICGAAAEFLLGWPVESFRPPGFPVSVRALASIREDSTR